MNQLQQCHQIQGCNNIFIDAFKSRKEKILDHRNAFILTHYHADHYVGLPRGKGEKGYVGPAKIHCTPITANLLREIHNVDSCFIVSHEYGETWNHGETEITFYDANHCPGAAIVFFKVPAALLFHNKKEASSSSSSTSSCLSYEYHLHTGDMRFHPKFKLYPLLREAVAQRRLDVLYLDTTYAHPKHVFLSQDDAVHKIASQVKELLGPNEGYVRNKKQSFFQSSSSSSSCINSKVMHKTLVLLSCYSIGKEKVLWNASVQSNQLVYVNRTKYKMLECITCGEKEEESHGIIQRCTLDAQKSDLHVIQMGLAGSLHPYFQPNFEDCAAYAYKLQKGYTRVVAFIPTGWANASKYNQNHAISVKRVNLRELVGDGSGSGTGHGNHDFMHVEIRLVAYSEHSSYSELRDCVQFMRPKRIIPTVFSNEKDYLGIEKRFADLVDSQRAKEAFIGNLLGGGSNCKHGSSRQGNKKCADIMNPNDKKEVMSNVERKRKEPSQSSSNKCAAISIDDENDQHEVQKVEALEDRMACSTKLATKAVKTHQSPSCCNRKFHIDDANVAQLVSMGFDASVARDSLIAKKNDIERAIEWLLLRK
jgi:Predicted exonuclease of the beta-lactamase fold involved in RNA processing